MSVDDATGPPGVIFDLDGTLVDTLDDITDSINWALARLGRPPVPCERIRSLIGEGLANLLRRASGIDDPNTLAGLVAAYRQVYPERMLVNTRPYPGIDSMLDGLVLLRMPMCVLSNKPQEYTAPICETLLGRWPFVSFRGCVDNERRKPDPTIALALANEMNRPPQHVYFVGDSSTDILTARDAGMIPVAVTWGYRDRSELEAAEPIHLADDPARLLEVLRNDPPAKRG